MPIDQRVTLETLKLNIIPERCAILKFLTLGKSARGACVTEGYYAKCRNSIAKGLITRNHFPSQDDDNGDVNPLQVVGQTIIISSSSNIASRRRQKLPRPEQNTTV